MKGTVTAQPPQPVPKEHHLVPQVYLKKFAEQNCLAVFRPRDHDSVQTYMRQNLVTVKKASARTDFYTLYSAAREGDPWLEKKFSTFEADYQPLWKRLRTSRTLSNEDKETLAFLTALQDVRAPNHRETFTNFFAEIIEMFQRRFRAANPTASDEEMQENLRSFVAGNFTADDVAHDPSNLALMGIGEALKKRHAMLRNMHVCRIVSTAHHFITSDSPVVSFDSARPPESGLPLFPMSLSVEVTYPLTRRDLLFYSYMPLLPTAEADAWAVHMFNARTAGHAHHEVFATPTDVRAERDRLIKDIYDRTDMTKSILPALFDHERANDVSLRAAAEAVGLSWDYVLQENREVVEAWDRLDIAHVDLGDATNEDGAAEQCPP
jgi:hypothetical protein